MSDTRRDFDPWALPTLFLWLIFFAVGLLPESVFLMLRDLSGVVTMNAYVNSPYVITIAFTLYLAVFAFMRCREAGLTEVQAQGRAVQIGLIGTFAFLWQPLGMVGIAGDLNAASRTQFYLFVLVIFAMSLVKMLSWLYLLSLVLSYYALGNRRAFAEMRCVFPSARVEEEKDAPVFPRTEAEAAPAKQEEEWEVFPGPKKD